MRTVIADVETNGLNPSKIWCIVCKEVETGEDREFTWQDNLAGFKEYADTVDSWVGHNFLGFDLPVLTKLSGASISHEQVVDTLIVSKLLDYKRPGGHSLEAYGKAYNIPKVQYEGWEEWHPDILTRCRVDVSITYKLYEAQLKYLTAPAWAEALSLEHYIGYICNILTTNGFFFYISKAKELKDYLTTKLLTLDKDITFAFPPRYIHKVNLIPRYTKAGTLHKVQERAINEAARADLRPDGSYDLYDLVAFNPKSTKDRIERLNEAGWKPTSKSKGHIDFLRSIPRRRKGQAPVTLTGDQRSKQVYFETYGWRTDEENLATLPEDAPVGARKLKERLLIQGKVTRLEEWEKAYNASSGRIHGQFFSIGSWPHRLSHAGPNMANVPKFVSDEKTPYSKEMRECWGVPDDKLLLGVDAEGIQLRIFAHIINDPELIASLVAGRKEDGTDPHSLNKGIIGGICKSRDAAKRFIYALFFDMGDGQAANILDCSREEAKDARERLIEHYPGYRLLKKKLIPECASYGYFRGLDGRYVFIPGKTQSEKEHFCLSGMLQNGEKVIMARSIERWYPKLVASGIPFKFVNWVHDEFQLEVPNDVEQAKIVGGIVANSLSTVGTELGLNCPMAGSILNSHGELAIGKNWQQTH